VGAVVLHAVVVPAPDAGKASKKARFGLNATADSAVAATISRQNASMPATPLPHEAGMRCGSGSRPTQR
jgi:hypothetical protein